MMQASDLNERITFRQKAEVTQPNGEVTYVEQDIAEVWAGVNPISGAEKYNASGDLVRKKYAFKVRYREDITEEMEIFYNGKSYDISVIDKLYIEQRNRFLYIEALYTKV